MKTLLRYKILYLCSALLLGMNAFAQNWTDRALDIQGNNSVDTYHVIAVVQGNESYGSVIINDPNGNRLFVDVDYDRDDAEPTATVWSPDSVNVTYAAGFQDWAVDQVTNALDLYYNERDYLVEALYNDPWYADYLTEDEWDMIDTLRDDEWWSLMDRLWWDT